MTDHSKRIISWLVLIISCFVIFGSSCFIILNTDHACSGGDCTVCTELTECHKTINTLGTAVAGTLQLTLKLCIVAALCKIIIYSRAEHTTLISLKVELLN